VFTVLLKKVVYFTFVKHYGEMYKKGLSGDSEIEQVRGWSDLFQKVYQGFAENKTICGIIFDMMKAFDKV
jgi:hypothetical protein